jgi:hypothetical protein
LRDLYRRETWFLALGTESVAKKDILSQETGDQAVMDVTRMQAVRPHCSMLYGEQAIGDGMVGAVEELGEIRSSCIILIKKCKCTKQLVILRGRWECRIKLDRKVVG